MKTYSPIWLSFVKQENGEIKKVVINKFDEQIWGKLIAACIDAFCNNCHILQKNLKYFALTVAICNNTVAFCNNICQIF